ncbi:hypothetical protein PTI98_013408 [Pleurotus ostreatus]|nr:hypothetical protein PTI98_013408 [Pleurotus ostreatus]
MGERRDATQGAGRVYGPVESLVESSRRRRRKAWEPEEEEEKMCVGGGEETWKIEEEEEEETVVLGLHGDLDAERRWGEGRGASCCLWEGGGLQREEREGERGKEQQQQRESGVGARDVLRRQIQTWRCRDGESQVETAAAWADMSLYVVVYRV